MPQLKVEAFLLVVLIFKEKTPLQIVKVFFEVSQMLANFKFSYSFYNFPSYKNVDKSAFLISTIYLYLSKMIRVRFALTTHGLEDRCSIQLSYQTIEFALAAQEQ